MNQHLRIALVFKTRLEENVNILNGISTYNRFHEKWDAFLDDQGLAQDNPDWLLQRNKWDGIISKHGSKALYDSCLEHNIPCVDLCDDTDVFEGIPKIRPDNKAIGHIAAEYYSDRGLRYFGFCGFSTEVWAIERREGFVEGLSLRNKECSIFENRYPKVSDPEWERRQIDEIGDWLEHLPKPAGIMACNDLRALQVIGAARSRDLQIPDQISVLGANNESIRCELSLPQLSSIPVNAYLYGQRAAHMISELIYGYRPKYVVEYIEPLDVVTRRSTDFLKIEDAYVMRALKIIKEGACEGLSVDEIASEVHASRSLLERRFRKFIGKSPQAEIRRIQMNRIKELLQETDYTLARIAELCGFDHPEYMCVIFKRMTQLTPKQYRNKVKRNLEWGIPQ